jgi:hypothetical protein
MPDYLLDCNHLSAALNMPSPIPVVPLAENPLFENWLAAVEEYRNRQELSELLGENTAERQLSVSETGQEPSPLALK